MLYSKRNHKNNLFFEILKLMGGGDTGPGQGYIFGKLTHIRTDFKKTIGRKDGLCLISGEISEITEHCDPQKFTLIEKIRLSY